MGVFLDLCGLCTSKARPLQGRHGVAYMGYTTRNAPAVRLGRLVWGWRCPTFTPVMGTIIGAKVFHCPVRNGKEWCHLAMAAKKLFNVSCLLFVFANKHATLF